jgi:glycogen debranching enzyme
MPEFAEAETHSLGVIARVLPEEVYGPPSFSEVRSPRAMIRFPVPSIPHRSTLLALSRLHKDTAMPIPCTPFRLALGLLFALTPLIQAQSFTSIPLFPLDNTGPLIPTHAELLKPFTVAGERGVLLGQQDGTFEAWVLPVKLLSHLTIEANVEGYPVPIDVNQQSAEIEVRPERTVITYSHPAFSVHQIMFSPDGHAPGSGPVVLFQFDCLHPTEFTFRFTPELRWMWPERNEGVPSPEWVPAKGAEGGFYVLHTDYPDLAGALTIPGAEPGILAPYQERPQDHPVELKLHIDPARDHDRFFPLLMAVGMTPADAETPALATSLAQLNAGIAANYQAHAARYRQLMDGMTTIDTPDKALNEAFQWATISIEQLKTKTQGTGETALVAGYYASADSARPGFGWFFGRDALYTLYAVNGYGDFALSKSELEFLIHRQRADGKIMHEYSQTAASVDWQSFPYMYAAADATPLFLLAVEDYVKSSGDDAFLAANRQAIERAWSFETDPAHDTDHDGIYDNSQGTGWVESWPGGMPHQEIYLALLDEQASAAMAGMEKLLGNPDKSAFAHQRAETIASTIEREYYDPAKACYAFSHNADGSQDRTATVYSAMAWWTDSATLGYPVGLAHSEGCLEQFAAHTLNTDWGLRDVSSEEKIYDGMSYHQGSVWPLFTGWAALAEYRANQPLAGYQMLMENANLTWFEDLGADTELLSGDFYVPFGRSTSHQLWSSAMVITPTLRGLFGITIDATKKEITVNPHLPPQWEGARVNGIALPDGRINLVFSRTRGLLSVSFDDREHPGWTLRSDMTGASARKDPASSSGLMLSIPLPDVDINADFSIPPRPGARTSQFRVLSQVYGIRRIELTIEGMAGSEANLVVLRHKLVQPRLKLPEGVSESMDSRDSSVTLHFPDGVHEDPMASGNLHFHFAPGHGWQRITIALTW